MNAELKKRINEVINEAEMILIGIGDEFAPDLPEFHEDERILPFVLSQYYASLPEDHEILNAYRELRNMVGAKPYFVVTMNTDDLVYRGGFWKDLVVSPCGSMSKMQCSEHIIEAAPIREQILRKIRENSLKSDDVSSEFDPLKIVDELARCPECGAPLHFHVKSEEGYLEKGYLDQWKCYNNWLTCTLGHKLCILELGVGFQYPQVIRWPFEKTAYFNQKATLIRVNSKFSQLPAELGEKGISVEAKPSQFLNEIV